MQPSVFWSIIEEARSTKCKTDEELRQKLVEILVRYPKSRLVAFQQRYLGCISKAYRWDLSVALGLVNGYLSDDSFYDFRDYLVSRGRETFEKIVADPESLLEMVDASGEVRFAEWHFASTPVEAYRIALGERQDNCEIELPFEYDWPEKLAGEWIDINDQQQIRNKLPRIYEFLVSKGVFDS